MPQPSTPSDAQWRYVDLSYDDDLAIRRVLAQYFLRYDAVLLQHGILDSNHQETDLIGILWRKEISRDGRFSETPSTAVMRNHLLANRNWFGLSEADVRTIQKNRRMLQEYIRDATSR